MGRTIKKFKRKKLITSLIAVALIATYAVMPSLSQAATFSGLEDTISDSDPNASAQSVTHTIVATTTVAMDHEDDYFEVVFADEFSDIVQGNVTCPSAGVAAVSGNTVTCTYSAGLATGAHTITITGTTNPSTSGSYTVRLYSKSSTTAELENGTMKVAIIDDVQVSATVEASLTFSIEGIGTSSEINGAITTGSSTDETLAFGIVSAGSVYTLGQQLNVSTNAGRGYTVTVQQDGNLQTAGGADIDTFKDGTAASTTPVVWASPTGSLVAGEDSYGHFGFTASDSSLSSGDPFGTTLYKGFYGTDPVEVMYNDGPSDGATEAVGSSTIAYTLEVSSLQETGDYTNNLTYICTPKY